MRQISLQHGSTEFSANAGIGEVGSTWLVGWLGRAVRQIIDGIQPTAGILRINCCSWSKTASPPPSFFFFGPGFNDIFFLFSTK